MADPDAPIRQQLDRLYRTESRRIFATLVRLLGDFDRAEEALHDAFSVALQQWPVQGVPANPRAWLVSTGRFRAIDQLRRQARFSHSLDDLADNLADTLATDSADPAGAVEDDSIGDDRLRLIFTCCHPALAMESRVALTLREVCGLTTEAIASAFLTPTSTLAQRIVRAKTKIRSAGIPYEVPGGAALDERLPGVLQVIYLLFSEGYSPATGERVTCADMAAEAIRLGELLLTLQPQPETMGLLALMLLQDARRATRTDAAGELVLLPDQERSRWNQAQIARGAGLVQAALRSRRFGPYCIQAAIAAVHAEAPTAAATDWAQIIGLYDVLLGMSPGPVVALNRAVAVSMRDGPQAGLALVDALLADAGLQAFCLAHAARADFLRQLGRRAAARAAYQRALSLARQGPEQRFLARRLRALGGTAAEH